MTPLHRLWPTDDDSFAVLVGAAVPRSRPVAAIERDGERTSLRREVALGRPTADAWPWLAQCLRGGGVYGWSRLETPTCRSAPFLVAGLPEPAPGDRLDDLLVLESVQDGADLHWRAPHRLTLLDRPLDDLVLRYGLVGDDGVTMLWAGLSVTLPSVTAPVFAHLVEVLDRMLLRPQVSNLARLAEHGPPEPVRSARRHQVAPCVYAAGAARTTGVV